MYHGILIGQEFKDPSFPKTYPIFSEKKVGRWYIYGVEVEDSKFQKEIQKIQTNMKTKGNWYVHLYNSKKLIVIFKNKVFKIKPNPKTWKPAIEYGKERGIPEEQLDFHPNKFQEEKEYFNDK